ncbi:hypothetical protein Drose_04235 [Dactylosporangium roseum]|uniref:Uncharacterized protein n=1 Tax=Dactylosporangium roseum TaxID=47989 RepID=A0ABY5Z906_9ACTN|nr:hypothetical protein [Dactylosporangium roseum]UWZ37498.1 hypothetical protein Drose_04235 [Dactylosporangium roseum]
MPVGTPIAKGMKPRAAEKMAKAAAVKAHPPGPAAARRPGGAAALFAAGAGKGRIHAAMARPMKPAAPTAVKAAEVPRRSTGGVEAAKVDIRAAFARLQPQPGAWVSLARLRDDLGDRHDRRTVDEALRKLGREPGVVLAPEANQKTLDARSRAAAVIIGDQPKHSIMMQPAAAPAPKARDIMRGAKTLDPGRVSDLAARLRSADSMTEARNALSGLTVVQLRQIATAVGTTVPSGAAKARIVSTIVEQTTGRRLDAAAIARMAARR